MKSTREWNTRSYPGQSCRAPVSALRSLSLGGSAAHAAVDRERVRRHHRAFAGGEVKHAVGDLVGGRVTAERDHRVERLGRLVPGQVRRAHLDVILEGG